MPIRIRCNSCGRKLSVATRKAGMSIHCPACGGGMRVPAEFSTDKTIEIAAVAAPPEDDEPDVAVEHRHEVHLMVADDDEGLQLRRPRRDFEEMDLTPMVDVTFLLLIFFMITASFTIQKTLPFPPPEPDEKGAMQTHTQQELQQDSIMVDVDEDNLIRVDDAPISDTSGLADLILSKMRSESKNELTLIFHPKAFHETNVVIIDAANEAGIQKIKMATRE